MLENITNIDLKILSLYINDYSAVFSIRKITELLNINYSHAFKRVKYLEKQNILTKKKPGQANEISVNIQNIDAIKLISYVEEFESEKLKTNFFPLLVKEAIKIDPMCCLGLFGSRVSGKATKESDWDIFIISQKEKRRELEKIMSKFPHARNIQLQVFAVEEFQESLMSPEETVVKHIVRNKHLFYNPHPFYNIIQTWELMKYAPKPD